MRLFIGFRLPASRFVLIKLCSICCLLFFFAPCLYADNASDITQKNISDFIATSYTPTFDCPVDALLAEVEQHLTMDELTELQRFQLTSMKTHSLICAGKLSEAQNILQGLLANQQANRSAQYYLSAIYQYGFIYDLQENPERCNYFMLARDSAKGKYSDIHTSASLAYVIECMNNQVDKQLFELYRLLEIVTKMNDTAALAHAYNRTGFFYSNLGHSAKAAAQYLKAYEIAKATYTDDHLLTLLPSAMTMFMVAGDFDKAAEVLNEYILINKNVNTPESNFKLYFLEAGLYVRMKDYERLALALQKWEPFKDANRNLLLQGVYRWYNASLCLHNKDIECLQKFVEIEENAPQTYIDEFKTKKDYSRFMVEVSIALNNQQRIEQVFESYADLMVNFTKILQDNNKMAGVVELHSKILNLETRLENQKQTRNLLMLGTIGVLAVIAIGLLWLVRRNYLERRSYDSITGLLSSTAAINKLRHVSAPSKKRTNALAIFDIANFTEVNLRFGSTKNDFVLKRIANTFKNITRKSDILGRFGPEQFIVCLTDIEEDAAQAFFDRAKVALSNSFADTNNHQSISVDSSMSIYYSTEPFSDLDEILKNMLLSLSMKADHS